VASAIGLIDGHVYSRTSSPRLLAGSVTAHTSVTSVSIELWRTFRGRCYAYDATRARLQRAGCRRAGFFKIPGTHGAFFKVASTSSFSYLLPSALPRGEYVLDILATDAAGNRTTPARGTSRTRFYVR
jgi:hypothetical protein